MSMKKMLAVVAAASLVAVAAPAFAANPFSDVPMNHWAYDAVEQLTAKGILEGYPNGTFKGNRAMTRYEIATMVARMMANGGVGGADAEKLKALIVEFAPELEALGVKVDGFDGRLSALEKGVGGWKLSGQMRFDYFGHTDRDGKNGGLNPDGTYKPGWTNNGFGFNRARIFMQHDMANGVSWNMRWNGNKIDRYWATVRDLFGAKGLTARIGAFYIDYESRDGLYENNNYWDDDSNFLSETMRGVDLTYKRGGLEFNAFYNTGSVVDGAGPNGANPGNENYGARLAFDTEKFHISANGIWHNFSDTYTAKYAELDEDGNVVVNPAKTTFGDNFKVYYFTLGFKPFRGVNLTGAYFMEKLSDSFSKMVDHEDDPKMWKLVLTLDQDLLKFTNLRVEYAKYDKGFYIYNGLNGSWHNSYDTKHNGAFVDKATWLKLSAIQKWGAKFKTFERYVHWDVDGDEALGGGKAKQIQLGVAYQYSPNLEFIVDWTKLDGKLGGGKVDKDWEDKIIRFRTVLNF